MRQVKVNIERPQVSSEEIKSRQDFESLFSRYKEINQKPIYKRYWMLFALAGLVGTGSTIYLLSQSDTTLAQQKTEPSKKTESVTKIVEEKIVYIDKEEGTKKDVASVIPSEKKSVNNTSNNNAYVAVADTTPHVSTTNVTNDNSKELEQKIQLLTAEINTLKDKIKNLEKNQPLKPVKAQGYRFKIDVLPSEFPKIAKYKGVLFEVAKDEKSFSPEFTKTEWDSGKIKEDAQGNYLLTLAKGKKSYTFKVFPVFEGNNYTLALKQYNDYQETMDSLAKEEKKKEGQLNEYMK